MKDLFELNQRAARLCWGMLEAQAAAWTVIGLRLPALAASATQSGPPSAENRRMIQEKINATQQGMLAGSSAATRLGRAAGKGPVAFASAMLDVFEASSQPAHTRVRANMRRLSRKALTGG
ncbi:MAG: hypothetical protein JWL62_2896 [Hyphomicrobiales bacterium]|nr:hypothetical protein [Hyphomicrobiales bacterium]